MTEVRIHGYLSKFFDLKIKIHLGRLNDVFRAICAIKSGFREKIIELQNKGYLYTFTINKNIIDIIPLIAGGGKVFRMIVAVVLVVVAVVAIVFQQYQIAFMALSFAYSIYATKFPQFGGSQRAYTGGATLNSGRQNQSYIFSNALNIATQGNLVPIGYGKHLIASKIINVSKRNYATSQLFISENISIANDSAFSFIL